MINECRQYLKDKLKDAGIKTKIITTMKELKITQENHLGAVLFESDDFEKSIKKRQFINGNGDKQKRTQKLERKTQFTVIIGEYSMEKCENIFDKFMELLDSGLYINGNYVELNLKKSDWVEDKDSIVKSKVASQILIEFVGGVYKDTGFKPISDIGVVADPEAKE